MLSREQITDIAQAFSGLPEDGAVWRGLKTLLEDQIREADDYATHHDTPEEKRAGWSGRKRGLTDLLEDLRELRSGGYRAWPEMKGPPGREEETETDEP